MNALLIPHYTKMLSKERAEHSREHDRQRVTINHSWAARLRYKLMSAHLVWAVICTALILIGIAYK